MDKAGRLSLDISRQPPVHLVNYIPLVPRRTLSPSFKCLGVDWMEGLLWFSR